MIRGRLPKTWHIKEADHVIKEEVSRDSDIGRDMTRIEERVRVGGTKRAEKSKTSAVKREQQQTNKQLAIK